jgi:hypothetical protein
MIYLFREELYPPPPLHPQDGGVKSNRPTPRAARPGQVRSQEIGLRRGRPAGRDSIPVTLQDDFQVPVTPDYADQDPVVPPGRYRASGR